VGRLLHWQHVLVRERRLVEQGVEVVEVGGVLGHGERDEGPRAAHQLGRPLLRHADERARVHGEQLVAGGQPAVVVRGAARHHRLDVDARGRLVGAARRHYAQAQAAALLRQLHRRHARRLLGALRAAGRAA